MVDSLSPLSDSSNASRRQNTQKRPSVCSANEMLFLAPPSSASATLSPNSVFPINSSKRRNSYAATTEATDRENLLLLSSSSLMSASGAILTSMSYTTSSSHFLDPASAASATASFKRRLPPTPLELQQPLIGRSPVRCVLVSRDGSARRSSSPRVLPPTPFEAFESRDSQQKFLLNHANFLTKKTSSTRRRLPLPPEPVEYGLPNSLTTSSTSRSYTGGLSPEWARQTEPGFNAIPLVRSSSTRSSRDNHSTRCIPNNVPADKRIHLPPPIFDSASMDSRSSHQNTRRTASVSHQRLSSEPLSNVLADSSHHHQSKHLGFTTSQQIPLFSPIAASAPPSPRGDDHAGENGSRANSLRFSQGTSLGQKRKSSDATSSIASDVAAIASLSLARNGSGSMAHLLEQQHILRREFNSSASPDSAISAPCESSSPSIEQLNCAAAGRHPMSRSGSEVDDPSIHGLDPSLYIGAPAITAISISSTCEKNGGASASVAFGATMATEDSRSRGLGIIHCALQLFPTRKRLRVSVLKIEGLAGELKPELEIQPFCKLSLMPGKKQQQQGVVKRGRDAVFNQEFFFDGISIEEIKSKQVRVEVCHQSAQKLQKDLDVGEVRILLKDLNVQLQTKKEVRVVEELRILTTGKKLGKLTITTCIEKEAKRLTINIIKVEDLPKWGIVGAPDVCIRIRMQQGSGQEVTKSSRIIKNSTSAVYKEAIMFLVSTKEIDLAKTKITITVHDVSRSVSGNDVIGFVFLGELAVDKSELDQWRSTMDHWSKEYKAVHQLKSSQTPEVYISEAHSDDEGAGDQ